jgi:hypothetical protein
MLRRVAETILAAGMMLAVIAIAPQAAQRAAAAADDALAAVAETVAAPVALAVRRLPGA